MTLAEIRKEIDSTDALIRELGASLDKLAADIQAVDSAYTSTKARNYMGFRDADVGFSDRIGLTSSLLCAVFILILAFTCVFLRKCLSDKGKEA